MTARDGHGEQWWISQNITELNTESWRDKAQQYLSEGWDGMDPPLASFLCSRILYTRLAQDLTLALGQSPLTLSACRVGSGILHIAVHPVSCCVVVCPELEKHSGCAMVSHIHNPHTSPHHRGAI